MDVALRKAWTQEAFFAWAERQEGRYEFGGDQPVARTGGNGNHSGLHRNILVALSNRLKGTPCQALGPDAGLATVGTAVRYPDALVTCSAFKGTDRLIPGVVAVFEVISPSSGHYPALRIFRPSRPMRGASGANLTERTGPDPSVRFGPLGKILVPGAPVALDQGDG